MVVNFFDITRQNSDLKGALSNALSAAVNSGRYILSENVASFEKEAAVYCQSPHSVGVASGTDALHLALRACGIGPGDEVITTPFTFVATAEAIVYCGATPVFVDIEPNSFNIDPKKIEEKINKKTKALLPVHLYGLACDMAPIMALAKKHHLKVVEDCAQAMGATSHGQQVGSIGDAGAFSFFPTKNLGCFGDGGLITAHDQKIIDELKVLRAHGSRKTYHHDIIGYNSRLDEIQAAILRVKLPHLNDFLAHRRQNAAHYFELLAGVGDLILPETPVNTTHTWNQFTVRTKKRDALLEALRGQGIGAMVYYPISLHLQKAFASLGYNPGDLPVAEAIQEEVLSLPIYPELSRGEIEDVAAAIRKFFNK